MSEVHPERLNILLRMPAKTRIQTGLHYLRDLFKSKGATPGGKSGD